MEPPNISELRRMVITLSSEINKLAPNTVSSGPVLTSGNFIPAGSIMYCRPSKFNELKQRIGASNIVIMDSVDTAGFCRGSYREAKKWTNEIYPTNIGPSCSGITSETSRIKAPPVNNNITPTTWYPTRLLSGSVNNRWGTGIGGYFSRGLRAMYITNKDTMYNELTLGLTGYHINAMMNLYTCKSPYWSGNPYISRDSVKVLNKTYIMGSNIEIKYPNFNPDMVFIPYEATVESTGDLVGEWLYGEQPEEALKVFKYIWEQPLFEAGDNGLDRYSLFSDDSLYIIFDDRGKKPTISGGNWSIPGQFLPHKVNYFQIDANKLDRGSQTPILTYGGYDRNNPPGTGPEVNWGRTNLLQIKILRDVYVGSDTL